MALVDDAVVEGRNREKLLDFSPLLTTDSDRVDETTTSSKYSYFVYHCSSCESIDPETQPCNLNERKL
jgi:hypothetical protein